MGSESVILTESIVLLIEVFWQVEQSAGLYHLRRDALSCNAVPLRNIGTSCFGSVLHVDIIAILIDWPRLQNQRRV